MEVVVEQNYTMLAVLLVIVFFAGVGVGMNIMYYVMPWCLKGDKANADQTP